MSFPCPVEGCDRSYTDWSSLREHLSEEHDQDATQESYRAWREEIGFNRITEQQRQQEQQQNRDRTGSSLTPLERDESPFVASDTSLACPVCSKVFDKGDLVSSFNSVKMHCIKSHGRQLKPSDFGLETEELAHPSPRKPAARAEEEGRPSIPDPYEHLKTMLTTFGLSSKNAAAISKYMESYSVDDLYKLIEGAAEYLPRSRLKLFIESWANVRGIPIAPELQEELGISHMPTSYGRYGPQQYDYRYGRRERDWQEPKDEVSQIIEKEYDELRRIRVIQALQGGGEDGSEVKTLRDEVLGLRDELQRRRDSKVEALERELQEEREIRHKQELASLREEFNLKLEGFRKEEGGLLERQAVRAIERVGDVSEKLVGLGERIVVGTAYKHHLLQEEAPPPRERQGPSGVAGLVPPEYIERGRAEAEG